MAAWGATKQSKALTLPGISPKASVVTFRRNIRFGNMPESEAIRKNVRENCRALTVRGYDEWGRRSIAFGLQRTAFDRVLVLYEKAFDMKYAKRSKLPRGLRWDAKSPHICFSWRDERGSQHQQSTHAADPAEAMTFKLRFLREKQDVVEVRKVRSMDQSRLALATAADLYFAWKSATNSPGTIGREKRMFKQVEKFIGAKTPLRLIDVELIREYPAAPPRSDGARKLLERRRSRTL
jgi:hypothetical protein